MEKLSCKGKYEAKVPEPGSLPVYGFKPKSQGPMGLVKEAMHKVGL